MERRRYGFQKPGNRSSETGNGTNRGQVSIRNDQRKTKFNNTESIMIRFRFVITLGRETVFIETRKWFGFWTPIYKVFENTEVACEYLDKQGIKMKQMPAKILRK